jgi:hypothetical protein
MADYDGRENSDSDESQIADFNFDSSDRSSPGLHQQGISLTSEHLREINDDRAEAERSSIRHAELTRENSGDSISKDPGYLAWRAGNDLIDQNSRGGSRIDTRRATREVISTVEGPTGVQVSSLNAHAVDIAPPPDSPIFSSKSSEEIFALFLAIDGWESPTQPSPPPSAAASVQSLEYNSEDEL